MGGAAFASGKDALYTPRMPPSVYQAALASTQAVLRTLFIAVATPIEGPEKSDFGDIDVLVTWPKDGTLSVRELLEQAAARLGAVRAIYEGPKATLAVPWPEGGAMPEVAVGEADTNGEVTDSGKDADNTGMPISKPNTEDNKPETKGNMDTDNTIGTAETVHTADTPPQTPFIQVDLNVTPTLESLEWTLFHHAHGDLWSMVGSSMRPLGLTLDEKGLWLRIPEIERAHRSRAKVLLTDQPVEVLHFLGLAVLDPDNGSSFWERPFPSAWAVFDYVASGRFFLLFPDSQPMAAHLKANDRRRLRFRPLYRRWVAEYVPAIRPLNRYPVASREADPERNIEALSDHRDRVRDAAFARFPGVAYRYKTALNAWVRERHGQDIWTAAKSAVPSELPSQLRGQVWAAVRRQLGLEKNAADGNRAMEEAAQAWTADGVKASVEANWEQVAQESVPTEYALYLQEKERNGNEARQNEARGEKT